MSDDTTTDSVTARRGTSSAPSIGVEEEFLLVDPDTGNPLMLNTAVAASAAELGLDLQLELARCQVETNSPVCWDAQTLRGHLLRMRSTAAAAAMRHGGRLIAVGTPLVGPWRLPITDADRYRRMAERFGVLTIEQGVCGCHVHVAVPDRETAVQVCNHVRPWLPTLLALGGNSSVHRGVDSGFASWRSILWSRWPASGPPPLFDSADHYDRTVATMVDAGVLMDERMVYWDIRPSCHLPTVELRVADVQATVGETVMLATLIRALAMTAIREVERGDPVPAVPLDTLRAATWLAAREGLCGSAIDPRIGRPVTSAHMLDALVAHVHDALDELGEFRHVRSALRRQLANGTGAEWQRRSLREHGDAVRVVGLAVGRTLDDGVPLAGNVAATLVPDSPLVPEAAPE
ncbi:glutamate--cysteine ligase [Rhodococcus sp. NPDC003318]|uniref:carboxylate-amine ligase n=1 Tax=Rhodococcus sp. NPDC003318 TaxID=3364503 RepID=UPI00368A1575